MLRSEAITIIKRGLGFRQTQDSAIVAALKSAQRDLELGQTLPSWLLVFDVAIPVTANVVTVATPTGFLRLHEDYPLTYTNADAANVFIPRRKPDEAYTAYVASGRPDDSVMVQTGTYPLVFSQLNKLLFQLYPTPTVSFTATLTYYKADATLDSEIENLWLKYAPDYLCGLAGMNVAGDLRDKGAVDRFTLMAKMGGKSFLGDIIEDELSGRPLIMGRNN